MAETLTTAQQSVLDFITSFYSQHQYPPTMREIASNFGWANPNSAACHLKPLRKKGYIAWEPLIARSITLLKPPKSLAEQVAAAAVKYFRTKKQADYARLMELVTQFSQSQGGASS